MAYNKVIFGGNTLIDLSDDTVTEENLLFNASAHAADGTIIQGKLFDGYPDSVDIFDSLYDSSDDAITDSNGSVISARIVYLKVKGE